MRELARSRTRLGLLLGLVVVVAVAGCARPRAAPQGPAPPIGYEERGYASWYGRAHHGLRTASGEPYDMTRMTAAHKTLPFGTWVRVENLDNHRTVEVRINDRGPFVDQRIIDLSHAAARVIGAIGAGLVPVRLRVIGRPTKTSAAD